METNKDNELTDEDFHNTNGYALTIEQFLERRKIRREMEEMIEKLRGIYK